MLESPATDGVFGAWGGTVPSGGSLRTTTGVGGPYWPLDGPSPAGADTVGASDETGGDIEAVAVPGRYGASAALMASALG